MGEMFWGDVHEFVDDSVVNIITISVYIINYHYRCITITSNSIRNLASGFNSWIWFYTLQGPFYTIFATELGERNANIYNLYKFKRCNLSSLLL